MANEDHLSILKQGIDVWNDWRNSNPGMSPDLSLADFAGQNLHRVNFEQVDLSGADLAEADLSEANLKRVNLKHAILIRANLSKANATQVRLYETNLSEANLNGSILRDSMLRQSIFRGASLIRSACRKATLNGSDFSQADLTEAELRGASLAQTNFNQANLHKADLDGANFSQSKLFLANLSNSKLHKANFNRCELQEADFTEANLTGANFNKAVLHGANLIMADLSGAVLDKADLSEADLSEAVLYETNAKWTNFNKAKLTGVCIGEWHINKGTQLESIECDYCYLKQGKQERRPSSGYFSSGDFEKWVQNLKDTVDLIFRDGLDLKAFTYAYTIVQQECEGNDVTFQGIENKGDGVVLVRLKIPANSDKGTIHSAFMNGYNFASCVFQEHYRMELNAKNTQITHLKQIFSQSQENNRILAEVAKRDIKPIINVEAKAMTESHHKNTEIDMNFNAPVTGAAGKVNVQNINPKTETETFTSTFPLEDNLEVKETQVSLWSKFIDFLTWAQNGQMLFYLVSTFIGIIVLIIYSQLFPSGLPVELKPIQDVLPTPQTHNQDSHDN